MDFASNGVARIINTYGSRVVLYNMAVKGLIFVVLSLIYTYAFAEDYTSEEDGFEKYLDLFYMGLVGILYFAAELYYGYHSVVKANAFEFYSFLIFSTITCYISGWRSYRYIKRHPESDWIWLIVTVNVIMILCQIFFYVTVVPLKKRFAWQYFKRIGVSIRIGDQLRIYEYFKATLKIYGFSTFMFFFMCYFYGDCDVDANHHRVGLDVVKFIIDVFLFLLTALGIVYGYQGVRRGRANWLKTWIYFVFCFQFYRLYKIIDLLNFINPFTDTASTDSGQLKVALYNTRASFLNELVCFISCGFNIYFGIKANQEFDENFREILRRQKQAKRLGIQQPILETTDPRTISY